MGGATKSHCKRCEYTEGKRIVVILQSTTAAISAFRSITWWCFAGLSNGDGPTSDSDIFRKTSEQLVQYMNSGNRLLHKNFLKQEVVQRFLRLLSSLQGIFLHNIQLC